MSTEGNKAIIRRFSDAINQKNVAIWDEVCAASCIFRDPPPGEITLEDYKKGISGWLATYPDWQLAINDEMAMGDKVIVRVTGSGTHAPTGKKVSMTLISIARIVDEKIVEMWTNCDNLGLYQQLGFKLVPPKGEKEG